MPNGNTKMNKSIIQLSTIRKQYIHRTHKYYCVSNEYYIDDETFNMTIL